MIEEARHIAPCPLPPAPCQPALYAVCSKVGTRIALCLLRAWSECTCPACAALLHPSQADSLTHSLESFRQQPIQQSDSDTRITLARSTPYSLAFPSFPTESSCSAEILSLLLRSPASTVHYRPLPRQPRPDIASLAPSKFATAFLPRPIRLKVDLSAITRLDK